MLNFCKVVLSLYFLFLFQVAFSNELTSVEQSVFSPLAANSLLLQSDKSDSLKVVVGERGHILYSLDNQNWKQALVETRQTLTNVFMIDHKTGWAVGHDAIIVKTDDGAKTWKKVFSDIEQEAPLLDLYFKDKLNGIALGAYSLLYVTEDGGNTWQKKELNIYQDNQTPLADEKSDNDVITDLYDIHLNDIAYAGNNRFYIAAESGHVLRSDDDFKNWNSLTLPYTGSFFGVLALSFDEVIAYGLRGNLYLSSDAGSSWKKIETGTTELLTDAIILSDGGILVSALAGTLLLSKDRGQTFSRIKLSHRHALTSILETGEGTILLTSDAGVEFLLKKTIVCSRIKYDHI